MVKKVKATLYLTEDKREKIRSSGLTVEEFCNRLFEMYERFTMDKWNNGVFSIEFFRVCLLRAETLNLILNHLEDESLYNLGREVGEKLQLTIENGFKNYFPLEDKYKPRLIEYLNIFSGWGNFTLENDTIIITMPIFTKPHFIHGYLEALLNHKLTLIESYPDRIIFNSKQS